MLSRSKLTIFQSKQSQFAEYLPYLQTIDKKCFRKSDRLVSLCMEELSKKSNSLFIAILNDNKASVCGYLLYSHTRLEASGRILKFAVHPDFQGQKIGTHILNFVVQHAQKSHAYSIKLHVAQHRVAALHVYQSVGFIILETCPNYYGDQVDAFWMEKILTLDT